MITKTTLNKPVIFSAQDKTGNDKDFTITPQDTPQVAPQETPQVKNIT